MMRRWFASPTLPLLALIALSVWPLLRAGYPLIGDGGNHLYRLVEFDHLLRNGVWFPRWATDLCYGYGCPLFNFYPPLVYYLGALLHAVGLSYADSLLVIYAMAFALAISGAYMLANEQWGNAPGLIAASASGAAPYLYFNALARGALPETLGLGLLPWALYAYVRLARQPTPKAFIAATLLYAAVILSHILSALLAAPLLIIFAGMALAQPIAPVPPRRVSLRNIPAAFVLALCLSAYFLLPALLETSAVQIHQLTAPGDLDFHNNFLGLGELFALPHSYDPKLVFIAVPPGLNLVALGLAVMGLASYGHRAFKSKRFSVGIWELGIGSSFFILGCLSLPLTRPLWEALPIANLIQFPWRLVGPASLLLALLAAAASHYLKLESWTLKLPSLFLPAFFFLFSITWTFAPNTVAPTSPTIRDLAAYEASTGQFGTTSAGEFLPKDVQQRPASDSLSAAYAERNTIDRLGPLTEGVTLMAQSATPTAAAATVNASTPSTLTFNIFYFPGWQAQVDGAPVAIQPSEPYGLITVPVNAGQHIVAVHFGLTPLRAFASGLSLLTLALLTFIAIKSKIWRPAQSPTDPITQSPNVPIASAAVALLCLRIFFVDGHETVFARSRFDGASVLGVGRALDVNFDNQLVLLGFDQSQTEIPASNPLPITLYWRAQNIPAADYSTTLQVIDAAGNLFGQSDSQHPGRTPTSRWRLDQYARDEHRLTLLPGTPPGPYTLTVGVYQFGGSGLSILDDNQIPQGQTYTLGPLTVTRATQPPTTIDAAQPLALPFGPLTLIGATLNTDSPQAGDDVILTLFWRAEGETRPDVALGLELIGADGGVIGTLETPLAPSAYPTSDWRAGEVVRLPLRFRIPANVAPGPAQLRASLRPTAAPPQTIASLALRVPQRSFTLPAPQHPRAEVFNETMKLLGYDVTATGLTLYWQALALMDTRYTVFIHTFDAEDHHLAQVDAVPQKGARPTTGWLPGEVITDTYVISLAGAAKIEIGMYNPLTLDRLGTVIVIP